MLKRIYKLYKHEDIQYLIKEGRYKLFQQIMYIGFSFLLMIYLANFTSQNFFGNYHFVITTLGLLSIFSFIGIKDAILQSVARGYEYSLIYGTKKAIKFSVLGSFILVGIASYYFFVRHQIPIALTFLLSSALFPFFSTLDNFNFFLEGKKEFKREFVYCIYTSIINFALIVVSIFLFKENLALIVFLVILCQTLLYLFFFLKCKKRIKKKSVDCGLEGYGWFITKLSFLGIIAQKIDQFIVGILLGPISLAVYSISISISDKLKDMIKSMFSTLMPKFADKSTVPSWRKLIFLFVAGILITLLMIILIPYFISYVFPKYHQSIFYGQLYSLILAVVFINSYLAYLFRGQKKRKSYSKSIIYSQINYLVIFPVLLYFFNITGLLIAKIMQNYIFGFFLVYYFSKDYKNK